MKRSLLFRKHAVQRMFDRGISEAVVREAIDTGEVIQAYHDRPYPSRLILGWNKEYPVHVVAAYDEQSQTDIIITVYTPAPSQWESDFKRKKSP